MQDTEIYTLRSFSLKKANWSLLCSWLMLYALKKKKVVCSVEHVEDSRVSIDSWLQSVLCQQSRLEALHMSFSFFVFLLFSLSLSLSGAVCYD